MTGKISDGVHTEFRCFSASQESLYPSVRKARWHNFEELKGKSLEEMRDAILASLPKKISTVRIHVSGDFFSQNYFDAWLWAAMERPGILFYAYTKSLPYWIARLDRIPTNFILTASRGGRKDELIAKHGLREARVVYSVKEAEELGLSLDHDDSLAYNRGPSFALLIHGTQPKGSAAGIAKNALKGEGSYSRGK